MSFKKWTFFTAALSLSLCRPAFAIDDAMFATLQKNMAELQRSVQTLQSTVQSQGLLIQQQNTKIEMLETLRSDHPQAGTKTGPSAAGPLKLAGLQGIQPEIGVAGTVDAKLTQLTNDEEGNDTIALKELELNIAQNVDPFSRLDAIIAFNDNLEEQNVDIEEAYYSHWGLPFGFRAQVGKFRAKIGKSNLLHTHALDTTDQPWVIRDFFGEEGLSASGARLVHDIPNPWDIPFELTGEVLRGNNGNSFSGISRRPIFNVHAKTFFETSENSNLELGWTTLFGDENPAIFEESLDEDTGETIVTEVIREKGQDRFGPKVFGADATWKWNLSEGRQLKWQNEAYFQNRGTTRHANGRPWGFYSLADYRFHPRFSSGIRFDYLEPLDVIGQHEATLGVSPYLTFWQSEFANFRLQYSRTEPAGEDDKINNEITLRANFLIGAHKHPVQ